MRFLKDIKIGTKLILGFITVALIAGVVGVVGINKINKTNENYTELYTDYGISIGDVGNASISHQRLKINLYKILLEKDTAKKNDYINKMKSYDNNTKENLLKFEKSIKTEEGKKQLSELKAALDKYNTIKDNIINLAISGKEDQGYAILTEDSTQKLTDEINTLIDDLFQSKISDGMDKSIQYSSEVNYAIVTMIIIIAIAVILAVSLGVIISRGINKSISKLMHVTSEISNGNLDVEIINDSKDEIGMLSESMKKMKYKLNQVIEYISFAAQQVSIGSKQIADSTVALSQGATEQASAVEELTASIEEISSQVKLNAENAKKANVIADNTKTNAVKRNSEMKLMLNAMDQINASSNNISKIIKVIDEIAFQTNILALNAAVEAARAGQYGKGFTVVAEEVRNLAARSANAAKETTAIIEESLVKIQDGTNIANQTAEALESIVNDIEDVAGLINGIAEASDEQATGISQISQGVIQISQVVQSNSATAEESAAASEELAGQAEVLKEQVSMFNLAKNNNHNSYTDPGYASYNNASQNRSINSDTRAAEMNNSIINRTESNTKRIILSDDEFGKY